MTISEKQEQLNSMLEEAYLLKFETEEKIAASSSPMERAKLKLELRKHDARVRELEEQLASLESGGSNGSSSAPLTQIGTQINTGGGDFTQSGGGGVLSAEGDLSIQASGSGIVSLGSNSQINVYYAAEEQKLTREERLRSKFADHSGFIRDRLESFVGREVELWEINTRIAEQQQSGGYVTITGQAGQGKSSIIAKLVQDYDLNETAHHFIPFNPGPDHQVSMLRNLMARLILKYDLAELYVASENRATLRDYFLKVLKEISDKGGQEVIFIDGLDQLEEETNGVRDLSFLPPHPPPGIVIVLGTRPNEILKSLDLIKPHQEYKLPNLSRDDFDLILKRRKVELDHDLGDHFYNAMQKNALYLDLVAKELTELGTTHPEDVIRRIADNPDNLFSLSIGDGGRLRRWSDWERVGLPVMGYLLAAAQPLSLIQLAELLPALPLAVLREGLVKLGGLIAQDGRGSYYLFHLKLLDYLRQDPLQLEKEFLFTLEDEQKYHRMLAQWCQVNLSSIWEDIRNNPGEQARREYARLHYITHLFKCNDFTTLFRVLDDEAYGVAKVQYDPSTRSYAHDLDWGRHAAADPHLDFTAGLANLPRLWRYTLLRCSLNSRADSYQIDVFETLVLLGRTQEAVGLSELLTDPENKVKVLAAIAGKIRQDRNREPEAHLLVVRGYDVAGQVETEWGRAAVLQALLAVSDLNDDDLLKEARHIAESLEENTTKAAAMRDIATGLAQAGRFKEAQRTAEMIESVSVRSATYRDIAYVLAMAGELELAQEVAGKIKEQTVHADALREIAKSLALAGKTANALAVLVRAQQLAATIESSFRKTEALIELAQVFTQAGETETALNLLRQARTTAQNIESAYRKTNMLREIAAVYTQAGNIIASVEVLVQAKDSANDIDEYAYRAEALSGIARSLAEAGEADFARDIALIIQDVDYKGSALGAIAQAHAISGQITLAKKVLKDIEISYIRADAMSSTAKALAQAGEIEQAEQIAAEIEFSNMRADVLSSIAKSHAESGNKTAARELLSQARGVASQIEATTTRADTLRDIGMSLLQAGEKQTATSVLQQACQVAGSIDDEYRRADALREIADIFNEAGDKTLAVAALTQAETVTNSIEVSYRRAAALRDIAKSFAQIGERDRAVSVLNEARLIADKIEFSNDKAMALGTIAKAMAHAAQWEQAKALITEIDSPSVRDYALRDVSKVMAQAGELELARQTATQIVDTDYQTNAIREIATAFAYVKRWEEAKLLAFGMIEAYNQAHTFENIARIMLLEGDISAAKEILSYARSAAAEIEIPYRKSAALRDLALVYNQAGIKPTAKQLLNEARQLANQIDFETDKVTRLGAVAVAFAQIGERVLAEEIVIYARKIAVEIAEEEYRAAALSAIASALVPQGGTFNAATRALLMQAQMVADEIEVSYRKAGVFCSIAQALAKAGDDESAKELLAKARHVANEIENTDYRADVLHDIANAYTKINAKESLLGLVQEEWIKANTRNYAVKVLPLATDLIPHLSALGQQFYDAFGWVDTFLKV